jgi:hypothetical protein
MGTSDGNEGPGETARSVVPPAQRGTSCDLYGPGHQMHYQHQGNAIRSPSRQVSNAFLDDSLVILVLDDGRELRWRHHDPDRLRRMLEALPGKRVVYLEHHALRVGPYWFNCAREDDDWQDCRTARQ